MSASTISAPSRLADSTDQFRLQLESILPSLRVFARNLGRDYDMADDLVQEAVLRAWSARDSFEPGTNFRAWIFTILQNKFYTIARKNSRMVSWDPEVAERIMVQKPEQQHVIHMSDAVRAMSKLPAAQREMLLLVGADGVSYEEAAAITGCAMGTVKSRLARGRAALAVMLDDERETADIPS